MLYTNTQTTLGEVFVVVYEANFETGVNQPVLKDNQDVAEYGTPDWSPDGQWLATGVRLVGNMVNRQIWMMKVDGSQASLVTNDLHLFAHRLSLEPLRPGTDLPALCFELFGRQAAGGTMASGCGTVYRAGGGCGLPGLDAIKQ